MVTLMFGLNELYPLFNNLLAIKQVTLDVFKIKQYALN